MIELKSGDIFREDVEALVNSVNCVGVMGRGIALQFKNLFPDNYEAYADALSKQFPELSVYWDSVANIKEIAAAHGATLIDAVVSSLPWANFSDDLQDELLDATMSVLAPDGQFATFSYVHGLVLNSGLRFRDKLERRFRSVDRSDVVWRSVPPAVVYHCQR